MQNPPQTTHLRIWGSPSGARGSTEKQQQPSCLHVSHVWDSVQQDLVLLPFDGQLCCDERLMPDWRSQHDNSLLLWGQLCVSSPHHSERVDGLCCPGQCLAPNWMLTSAVPNLRLSMVDGNATMGLDLLLKNLMNNQHSLRCTISVHIVEVTLPLAFATTNALCRLRQKKRVALLSALTLRDYLCVAQLVVPEIRGRLSVKLPNEWESAVGIVRLQQTSQHRVATRGRTHRSHQLRGW